MALVDYPSSDDGTTSTDEGVEPPPSKRQRQENVKEAPLVSQAGAAGNAPTSMPPLPANFFDLYASTVRHSVSDDPTLHQGRKRQTPHVAGHWPSHVYVEWHPVKAKYGLLHSLIQRTRNMMGPDVHIQSFLTSELGTQVPLHISLSRPLGLPTASKDDYLDRLCETISAGGIPPFAVRPVGLAWYKSPDSDRTFFVLRVEEALPLADGKNGKVKTNASLMNLLAICNRTAVQFEQPPLYQRRESTRTEENARSAFHISIGWTLGSPDEETCIRALQLFKDKEFRALHSWDIEVTGIKVKVGNAITHVPLSTRHERRDDESLSSFY